MGRRRRDAPSQSNQNITSCHVALNVLKSEPRRVVVGQRAQQDPVSHRPQRGKGADAQRQGRGGSGGVQRIVAESTERLGEGLTESVHEGIRRIA